ncbi:DEAD/DEAH box helicase [Secundilactobacillus collinoides]|uniref:DEAD/DEAH box helicase n=1 Tax=Secundilactobacillus collinoides TaxID=33960 RepID=UPI0006D1746A|nr:DEAD/DEAH box helicase [Secundilactobacillus collinoides]
MIAETTFYQQLKQRYGFESFRPGQLETLTALATGQDVLSIMPTGAGKSLIYELYGQVTQQLVVIVSPLIALMQDQVASMNYHGEKRVTALTSMMSYSEKAWTLTHLNKYRYLFVSPEMLTQERVMAQLQQQKVGLFVVDEAHCISTWGPDFRPEYLLLGQTREQLGAPLTLMLTATATRGLKRILNDGCVCRPPV